MFGSQLLFWKINYVLFSKDTLNSKDIYNVTKDFYFK